MIVLGYKYTTENEAKEATKLCDQFYGYPKEGCLSKSWCEYEYYVTDDFYYIVYGDTLKNVLGEPSELNIKITNPL